MCRRCRWSGKDLVQLLEEFARFRTELSELDLRFARQPRATRMGKQLAKLPAKGYRLTGIAPNATRLPHGTSQGLAESRVVQE